MANQYHLEYVHSVDDGLERELLAIIIGANFQKEGVHFFTDPSAEQQVAYIFRKKGDSVPTHRHPPLQRVTTGTHETLVIRSGMVTLTILDCSGREVCKRQLGPGDVAVLVSGGHGLYFHKNTELVEVKMGPHYPDKDKVYL